MTKVSVGPDAFVQEKQALGIDTPDGAESGVDLQSLCKRGSTLFIKLVVVDAAMA